MDVEPSPQRYERPRRSSRRPMIIEESEDEEENMDDE